MSTIRLKIRGRTQPRHSRSDPLGVVGFDSSRGLSDMTERKNLKIAEDTYDDLREAKRDMETWDAMFRRLLAERDTDA